MLIVPAAIRKSVRLGGIANSKLDVTYPCLLIHTSLVDLVGLPKTTNVNTNDSNAENPSFIRSPKIAIS
jgi:hypothetical protein